MIRQDDIPSVPVVTQAETPTSAAADWPGEPLGAHARLAPPSAGPRRASGANPPAAAVAPEDLERVLNRMRVDGLAARRDPLDPAHVILVRAGTRGSLGAGRVARSLIDEALRRGTMVETGRGVFALCAPAAAPQGAEAKQGGGGTALYAPQVNDAESPLMWLHRRSGADGVPLIDERAFLAGERFRRDVTQAAMLPSVTTNWSRMESAAGRNEPRDPALATDVVIAARERVRAAFRLLGPDTGHFILDVCGFLVPLQEAESRRSWPARSGKLVLKLALARLADHYGIETEARGAQKVPIASWQATAERASIEAWLLRAG